MLIERINAEDIPDRYRTALSAENRMAMELDVGEAYRAPCRWGHNLGKSVNHCGGSVLVRNYAIRHGRRVKTVCAAGVFYVRRVA